VAGVLTRCGKHTGDQAKESQGRSEYKLYMRHRCSTIEGSECISTQCSSLPICTASHGQWMPSITIPANVTCIHKHHSIPSSNSRCKSKRNDNSRSTSSTK
jgi:hypothetical protein